MGRALLSTRMTVTTTSDPIDDILREAEFYAPIDRLRRLHEAFGRRLMTFAPLMVTMPSGGRKTHHDQFLPPRHIRSVRKPRK